MRLTSFILTFILGSSLNGLAQNVVNGSFEKWDQLESYKADSWFSPTRNVSRTTDAKQGKYALKLENSVAENGTGYYSYAYNRYPSQGLRGFAFSDDVLSLVFWAKYDLAEGDSARIIVYMREEDRTRGYVNFIMYGTTNDNYVKHSVPIYWYGPRTPDTAWIYLYSYTEGNVDGPGYIIFDDIHFENIGHRGADMTNQGFEVWDDYSVHYPSHWRSLDLLYLDNYSAFLAERSAFRSNDAIHGQSSLQLTNYDNNGTVNRSYIYIGTEDIHRYTPSFRIYNRYAYLQGYYKMESPEPDSAYLQFRMYKGDTALSNAVVYFTPNHEWDHFSVPINYYYDDKDPDSAYLSVYSCTGTYKSSETSLKLDGLDLVMEPWSVSVDEQSLPGQLYPNPAQHRVNLDILEPLKIEIYDNKGQLVETLQLSAGQHHIDVSSWTSGIYILKAYNKHKQWQKKIVKQ